MGVDPKGKELYLFGNVRGLEEGFVNKMAGEFADRISVGDDGKVTFNVTADEVAGNPAAERLLDLTKCVEKVGLYWGDNAEQAASYFKDGNSKNTSREGLAKEFAGLIPDARWDTPYEKGGGKIIGTQGRSIEPRGDFFAFIALNSNTVLTQDTHRREKQERGNGKPVSMFQFYLHESIENYAFIWQARLSNGLMLDYNAAHSFAVDFEIDHAPPQVGGGFGGSKIESVVQH